MYVKKRKSTRSEEKKASIEEFRALINEQTEIIT